MRIDGLDTRYPTGVGMVLRPRTTCPKSTADLLLPTAGTASPEHFALLMNSLWAEDRALSKTLVLAMLPTVMGRPDRYGHSNDPYNTEILPLLGVLVGSSLSDMETMEQARESLDSLDVAIDMTILATRPLNAMLPESYQARLTKAFDKLTSDLSPLVAHAQRSAAASNPVGATTLFSSLGRLRQASAVAKIDDDRLHPAAATKVSATLRRLWSLDEALALTMRILEQDPRNWAAGNDRAAIHADAGNYGVAHQLAKQIWDNRPSCHTARLLCRTAKATGDKKAFEEAVTYLERNCR